MEAWANMRSVEMEGNGEHTRKGSKKDISTSSFHNLHWYRNGDRNMAGRAKESNMLQ